MGIQGFFVGNFAGASFWQNRFLENMGIHCDSTPIEK